MGETIRQKTLFFLNMDSGRWSPTPTDIELVRGSTVSESKTLSDSTGEEKAFSGPTTSDSAISSESTATAHRSSYEATTMANLDSAGNASTMGEDVAARMAVKQIMTTTTASRQDVNDTTSKQQVRGGAVGEVDSCCSLIDSFCDYS